MIYEISRARARGVVVRGADFSSLRRAGAGSSLPSSSLSHLVFSSSFSLPVAPSRVLFSNFTRYDVINSLHHLVLLLSQLRNGRSYGRGDFVDDSLLGHLTCVKFGEVASLCRPSNNIIGRANGGQWYRGRMKMSHIKQHVLWRCRRPVES